MGRILRTDVAVYDEQGHTVWLRAGETPPPDIAVNISEACWVPEGTVLAKVEVAGTDYEEMKVKDLLTMAEERGLFLLSQRKADIITALKEDDHVDHG